MALRVSSTSCSEATKIATARPRELMITLPPLMIKLARPGPAADICSRAVIFTRGVDDLLLLCSSVIDLRSDNPV
jgi:hypothetical protein